MNEQKSEWIIGKNWGHTFLRINIIKIARTVHREAQTNIIAPTASFPSLPPIFAAADIQPLQTNMNIGPIKLNVIMKGLPLQDMGNGNCTMNPWYNNYQKFRPQKFRTNAGKSTYSK